MIPKFASLSLAFLFVCLCPATSWADGKLGFEQGDTISTLLLRQTGQVVEFRLKSGEKIGGRLEKVGDKLVHLTQLAGAEFFEAAVSIDEIGAVVVRAAK